MQELHFEDGDLHGSKGRQRKFRWKHTEEDKENGRHSEDSSQEEDEEDNGGDQEWQRESYQRDKFILEQDKSSGPNTSMFFPESMDDSATKFTIRRTNSMSNSMSNSFSKVRI